jgi:hypothetical protein
MTAYGSINIHNGRAEDVTIGDEETALLGGGGKSPSSLRVSAQKNKKRYTTLFLTLAIGAAVIVFVSSGAVSPLYGLAAVGDGDTTPTSSSPFNWAEWGAKMKSFWAEKKRRVHCKYYSKLTLLHSKS